MLPYVKPRTVTLHLLSKIRFSRGFMVSLFMRTLRALSDASKKESSLSPQETYCLSPDEPFSRYPLLQNGTISPLYSTPSQVMTN